MRKKEPFSRRNNLSRLVEKEITVREDAPKGLRGFVSMAFYSLDKYPSELRDIVCRILKTPPDRDNWSEVPNIDWEVNNLLETCDWYYIYDIIEAVVDYLADDDKKQYIDDINEYFYRNGIGWKIQNNQVETRGDELFETAIRNVDAVLKEAELKTARTEMKEAISDLSRRPKPDITGAIQHSLACLECVSREAAGDKKSTLGELMKKHPYIIPKPLDIAIDNIWGYTSENGRHLREGRVPEHMEAELIVELTAAISNYLSKKLIKDSSNSLNI